MNHPLDTIARVCHEVNRAYCQALGDDSQPAWDEAPEWQRSSARMGVDLHLMGDFGPEASHISWMNQKLDEGWKYGPVKNPEAKEHPCIVPFAELPREQQAKDYIFRAVVHALRDWVRIDSITARDAQAKFDESVDAHDMPSGARARIVDEDTGTID